MYSKDSEEERKKEHRSLFKNYSNLKLCFSGINSVNKYLIVRQALKISNIWNHSWKVKWIWNSCMKNESAFESYILKALALQAEPHKALEYTGYMTVAHIILYKNGK